MNPNHYAPDTRDMRNKESTVNDGDRLPCPACRLEIATEDDHEPDCPNGDWDRGDVIQHIMRQSAKEGDRGQGQRPIGEERAAERTRRERYL